MRETGGLILITGATGHLGANLVRRLLDLGHPLRVLVRE
ncbi:MAG: NmrA family NAD(P)-binding protein, partial [Gammaproteobacteria bacterium]